MNDFCAIKDFLVSTVNAEYELIFQGKNQAIKSGITNLSNKYGVCRLL